MASKVVTPEVKNKTPFASLFKEDTHTLLKVYEKLEDVIFKSIALDKKRDPLSRLAREGPTANEIKHRFDICEEWIRRAIGDLNFTYDRTMDLMGHVLRCKLDGINYEPEKSKTNLWIPT